MAEINNVIAEASQDLQTIEDFVNLPAGSDVRPRLLPSVNVGTLAGARQAIFENGGLPATPFATKSIMEGSGLLDGVYAIVTDDAVSANNGLYLKASGSWVKSKYDPFSQVVEYIEAGAESRVAGQLYDSSNDVHNDFYIKGTKASPFVSGYPSLNMAVIALNGSGVYTLRFSKEPVENMNMGLSSDGTVVVGKTLTPVTLTPTSDPKVFSFDAADDDKYLFITVYWASAGIDEQNSLVVTKGSGIGIEAYSILGFNLADDLARSEILGLSDKISNLSDNNLRSPLRGKKWVAIGDSITESNFRADKNYHDYIIENVGDVTFLNMGVSSYRFKDHLTVQSKITDAGITDPDLITVFLGTNDFGSNGTALGEFLDEVPNTIYGAINLLISNLTSAFLDTKLLFITPLPRPNQNNSNQHSLTLWDISDAIKKTCRHYSIPVLDLQECSNLRPDYPDYASKYIPDGVHPNALGHKVIYPKIQDFIEANI